MAKHDYLGDRAANYKLMNDIKAWWRKRGCIVRVWMEKASDPQGGGSIHIIRTNIVQHVSTAQGGYFAD